MQLHYYRDLLGNFGDDLNPVLWRRFLPGVIDGVPGTVLIGIGTLLGGEFPDGTRKVVMGAGTGYGPPPRLDATWDVRFVRGPMTAAALGLPPDRAIADPAILVGDLLPPAPAPAVRTTGPVLFIPHHVSARFMQWRRVCRLAGLEYADPTGPPLRVARQIQSARLVLTEAMHGAIIADALRVPWIGVAIYPHINRFKWQDWLAAMELVAELHEIPPLLDGWHTNRLHNARLAARAARRSRQLWPLRGLGPPDLPAADRPADAPERMAAALRRAAALDPALSRDAVHRDRLARVRGEVLRFRQEQPVS